MRDAQNKDLAKPGQILSIANSIQGEIMNLLLDGKLSYDQADQALKQKGAQTRLKLIAKKAVDGVFDIQIPVFPEKTNNLKLLSGKHTLVLDKCEGGDVITPKNQKPFDWIDDDFVNWGADETDAGTEETPVGVYEMAKNANFQNLFGSFGVGLDQLCLTHSQIKNFVKKFRNWLRTDGYTTFFLFKSKGKFFVVDVNLDSDGKLEVDVHRLKNVYVWDADNQHRLVVPQFRVFVS